MQVVLTGSTSHECEVCSFRLSACHQPVILWCAGKHEKAVPLKQPSSNAPLAFIPSGVAVCYYGNSVTFAGGWKTTNGCFLVDPVLSVSISYFSVYSILFKRQSWILCCFSKADPCAYAASRLLLHSSSVYSTIWEMPESTACNSCL